MFSQDASAQKWVRFTFSQKGARFIFRPMSRKGQAPLIDGQMEVGMSTFTGADFPPDFASAELVSAPWGTAPLQFTGPNGARVDWVSGIEGYGSGGMDLVRLTQLAGHSCE